MRIAITGSHGFIGSRLFTHFSREHIVQSIPRDNVRRSLLAFMPDYIFHLASYGNMANQNDTDEIVHANVYMTHELLETVKLLPIKGIIFSSTSSVYGKVDKPMKEAQAPHPLSCYAAAKVGAEAICQHFSFQYRLPLVILRLFSVYGPGEASFRFIPTVIRQASAGEIVNLATGRHDWIYIDDVLSAMEYFMMTAKKYHGEVFNIGTGKSYKNIQVIKMIGKLLGREVMSKPIATIRPYDSQVWRADITKSKKAGWVAATSFEKGLSYVIDSVTAAYH